MNATTRLRAVFSVTLEITTQGDVPTSEEQTRIIRATSDMRPRFEHFAHDLGADSMIVEVEVSISDETAFPGPSSAIAVQ